MADIFPESREEEILVSMIDGEEYNKAPESRIEALLLELKEVIEEGGGGGGTTNYNLLQNKPSINSVTLTGDKSSADLDIPTASDLAGKQDALPVTASGNDVAFNGELIDGQGNTLSVLAEALTKTASGNPVVIDDCAGGKARSLKTTIEAIQDLHGYDHPWTGGAGKNKWSLGDINVESQSGILYSLPAGTYTISCDLASTMTLAIRFKYANDESELVAGINQSNPKTFTLASDCVQINTNITGFVPGTVIHNIQIESGSTATSFAPYSNECPISGRTEETVDDTGRNQLPLTVASIKAANTGGTWNGNAYTYRGIVYTLLTDSADNITGINVNGNNTGTTSSDLWIPVNQTIDGILNGCPSGGSASTYLQTVWSDQGGHVASDTGSGVSVAGIAITNMSIRVRGGVTISNKVFYPMIRSSSDTDPTFVPYAHSSATIQLGQTVYGADINWDTGVMTVTWVKYILSSTGQTWIVSLSEQTIYANFPDLSAVETDRNQIKCSHFKTDLEHQAIGTDTNYAVYLSASKNLRVNYRPNGGSVDKDTITDFFDAQIAAGTPVEICGILATPTTLQLTPTQLELLKGYNRVTIENGTITLDYIAKAISGNDEEIAPLVGDKATKSYAVNDFIERNDGLYRVTASIASGASFTANNTVKMSIGEALTYLYNK